MSNLINCITCNNPLIKVFYECTSSDYRIIDEDNNLLFIKMEHDLPNDSDEIGTKIEENYCSTCKHVVNYPTRYENNEFKNNELIMNNYINYLNKCLIHSFSNINCKYCNTLLEKGYYQNTTNSSNHTIHIYNETTQNKIKDIDIDLADLEIPTTESIPASKPLSIDESTNLSPAPAPAPDSDTDTIPETISIDIGKKIIYCPNCNFFITNRLDEIYKSD